MAQPAAFSSDTVGRRIQVVTLDGRCDVSTALEAEQRITNVLKAGRSEIVFDLRGVISLCIAMLHVLFRGLVQTKAQRGSLVLVRPNATVWALFERSGLDKTFVSGFDLQEALLKVSGPSASGQKSPL